MCFTTEYIVYKKISFYVLMNTKIIIHTHVQKYISK